jgi:thioredoxin:protein disulfide reductase
MKYVRLIGFVTLVPFTLGLTAAPVLAASAKPADQPFRLSVLLDEGDGIELLPVAPSYFLYRERGSATLDGKPLKVSTARGVIKDHPAFRSAEIYHREAIVHVDGKDLPELGELLVTYQGCRKNAVCYSPITKSIDLATFFINDEVLVSYQGCVREQHLLFADHEV